MVFDKNRFKEAFRAWASSNPQASCDQALEFCHSNIPAQHMMKQNWLVEQSLQWFEWLGSQRSVSASDSFNSLTDASNHDDETLN